MRSYVMLGLLLVASKGLAETPKVAVLPLRYEAPLTASQAEILRIHLNEAIKKQGLESIPLQEVDRLTAATDAACQTDRCLSQTAQTIGASRLIGGRLSQWQEGGDPVWTLGLWLFDAQKVQTVAVVQNRCPGCDETRLKSWTADLFSKLQQDAKTSGEHARIYVTSNPQGATISIDGTAMGATPMMIGASPGRHSVTLTMAGYKLAVREIDITADEIARIYIELEADSTGARSSDPTKKGGFFSVPVFKWITLVAGSSGLISGAVLLGINGQQSCDTDNSFIECREERSSKSSGMALLISGGISAIASAVLFYLDRGE